MAALRGHSNVQGATDMGTLYHMLPGYPAMPLQGPHPTLAAYLDRITPGRRLLGEHAEVHRQPVESVVGDAATRENDYAYDYLPKRRWPTRIRISTSWPGCAPASCRASSARGRIPRSTARTPKWSAVQCAT